MNCSWLSLLHCGRKAQNNFGVATCFADIKECLKCWLCFDLRWSRWPRQLQCHAALHSPPELYGWIWQNVEAALSFMLCLVWSVLRLPVVTWNSTLFLCQVTPPPVGHIVTTCLPLTCVYMCCLFPFISVSMFCSSLTLSYLTVLLLGTSFELCLWIVLLGFLSNNKVSKVADITE